MDDELSRKKGQEYNPINAAIEHSDYVFLGIVQSTIKEVFESINQEQYTMRVLASFEISETIKGNPRDSITILSTREPGGCSCIYDFEPGVEYLVFASEREGKYYTYHCDLIHPKERSAYESITRPES